MTNEVSSKEVIHIHWNIINNNLNPNLYLDNTANIIISRLCILHLTIDDKYLFLSKCFRWLTSGGYIAIEDYAESKYGISNNDKKILINHVAVPDGKLLTVKQWIDLLTKIGFIDIQIIDLTKKWKLFITDRTLKAELNKTLEDKIIGNKKRIFYKKIDELFSNNNILGIKIYAKKK